MDGCPHEGVVSLRFLTIQRSRWSALPQCLQSDFTPLDALSAAERDAFLSSLRIDTPGEGRDEFFEAIVNRPGDLFRNVDIAADLLAQMIVRYRAEGLQYLETQFRLTRMIDEQGNPVPPERALQRLRARLGQADVTERGVAYRFLYTFIRFSPDAARQAEEGLAWIEQHPDLWVGLNMAGREDNPAGKPNRLLPLFRDLRRRHPTVPLSLHGGEVDEPGRDVRDTLLLGASRIGHGVNLVSDPDGMLALRGSRYLLEVCLVSNHLLGYTPDPRRHPFPEYLRTGVPVTLSTDDPGSWDSTIADEYYLAVQHFGLSWNELDQIARNGLDASFAPPQLKTRLKARYIAARQRFELLWLGQDWRKRLHGLQVRPSGYARRHLDLR
jgi:adenosine deaminase CECR1